MAAKEYAYTCEEHSLLYPLLKKYIWQPLLPLIPVRTSANTLTIIGHCCSWLAFASLLVIKPEHHRFLVIPALLNLAYLSADNMDGMQARRTKRSSSLGEFLDHWGDSFNCGLMTFGFGMCTGFSSRVMLAAMAAVLCAYFATFWEQRLDRRVIFGRMGSVEAVVLGQVVYLAMAVVGVKPFTEPLLAGLSFSQMAYLAACFSSIWAVGGSIHRVGRRHLDFASLFIAFIAIGTWWAWGKLPLIEAGFLVLFTGALLGGRTVVSRVLDEPLVTHNFVFLLLLGISTVASLSLSLSATSQSALGMLVILWLAILLAVDLGRVLITLRHQLAAGELLAHLIKPSSHPQPTMKES